MSGEGPVGDYVRRARRAAEQAGRKAAAPIVTARRQRDELERALVDLEDTRGRLEVTRGRLEQTQTELDRVRGDLDRARADQDTRRAGDSVEQVIVTVLTEHLSDLPAPALRDLALAAQDLELNRTTGAIVEAGSGPVGSAAVLAVAKAAERPMTVYGGSDLEPGDALEAMARLGVPTSDRNLVLVEGDVEAGDEPVALGHVIGAAYATTLHCLQRLAPVLVSGGRVVVDGYATSPDARTAVDEYFRDRHMDFRFEQHNRLHVVRR